jgi:hypothetical protein
VCFFRGGYRRRKIFRTLRLFRALKNIRNKIYGYFLTIREVAERRVLFRVAFNGLLTHLHDALQQQRCD